MKSMPTSPSLICSSGADPCPSSGASWSLQFAFCNNMMSLVNPLHSLARLILNNLYQKVGVDDKSLKFVSHASNSFESSSSFFTALRESFSPFYYELEKNACRAAAKQNLGRTVWSFRVRILLKYRASKRLQPALRSFKDMDARFHTQHNVVIDWLGLSVLSALCPLTLFITSFTSCKPQKLLFLPHSNMVSEKHLLFLHAGLSGPFNLWLLGYIRPPGYMETMTSAATLILFCSICPLISKPYRPEASAQSPGNTQVLIALYKCWSALCFL